MVYQEEFHFTYPQTSIEELPIEVLSEIFSLLCDVKDLLACGSVCSLWNFIYKTFFKLTKLTITDFHINEMIPIKRVETLEESPDKFRNFFLPCKLWNAFKIKQSELTQGLKRLSVTIPNGIRDELDFDLQNLEILTFETFNFRTPVKIICPLLRELTYYELTTRRDLLCIYYPRSVKILSTNLTGERLRQFTFVEKLNSTSIWTLKHVNRLPCIKEVNYEGNLFRFYWWTEGVVEHTKGRIQGIVRALKELRNPDIKFSYAGFQVDLNENFADKLKWCHMYVPKGGEDSVYQLNISKISKEAFKYRNAWIYRDFMSKRLAQKLSGVEEIEIDKKVKSEKKLLKFIKNLKSLIKMDIFCRKQTPTFYERLPAAAPKLRSLVLGRGCVLRKGWKLKLDILNKFPELIITKIYSEIWREGAEMGLEWLARGGTRDFEFEATEGYFCVRKRGKKFLIQTAQLTFVLINLDGILDMCYAEKEPEYPWSCFPDFQLHLTCDSDMEDEYHWVQLKKPKRMCAIKTRGDL